ncbi:MAG: hypothetical protein AAF903_07935 [Pseudomonadota bacterium]
MGENRATMTLLGPFSVSAADQTVMTPGSKKACGLLALLAMTPGHKRSRRWLQGMLWSDRGQEQANASLRQCLSEIRKVFGPNGACICIEGSFVSLPEHLWHFDFNDTIDLGPDAPLFLEGHGIRDKKFQAWVQHYRSKLGTALRLPTVEDCVPSTPPSVFYRYATNGTSTAQVVSEALASQLGQDIAERMNGRLFALKDDGQNQEKQSLDIDVRCVVAQENEAAALSVDVLHAKTGMVLYQRRETLEADALGLLASSDFAQVTYEGAERAVFMLSKADGITSDRINALRSAQSGIDRLFKFTKRSLLEADQLLQAAWELDRNPNHLAWRAYIRDTQCIERLARDDALARTQARDLMDMALERGPENPIVLALCSLVTVMLFGEVDRGLDLARFAIKANPNNPLALQSLAMAQGAADQGEDSYKTSQKSQKIVGHSPYSHWWNTCHALTCVATGRLEEALNLLETSIHSLPKFRPALRILLALYGVEKRSHDFNAMLTRLKAAEPDFTLDRFLNDPNYPVRTIRKAGLLDKIRANR